MNLSNPSDPFIIQLNTGPQMQITNISLSIDGSIHSNIKVATQSYNIDTQIMSFTFDIVQNDVTDIIMDNGGLYAFAILNIQFNGLIRNDMKGFYISKYEACCYIKYI